MDEVMPRHRYNSDGFCKDCGVAENKTDDPFCDGDDSPDAWIDETHPAYGPTVAGYLAVTNWYPAHIKPVRPGIYQKHVNGYIRYANFNGREWCAWVESIKTAMYPSYRTYEHPDTVNPWRGLKTPNV